MPTRATSGLCAVRMAYGGAALASPAPVLRIYDGPAASRLDRGVLRILGARHMVQAALTMRMPRAGTLAAGAGVDAVHALSMLVLARHSRERRTAALRDATAAGVLALLGTACSYRAWKTGGRRSLPTRSDTGGPNIA